MFDNRRQHRNKLVPLPTRCLPLGPGAKLELASIFSLAQSVCGKLPFGAPSPTGQPGAQSIGCKLRRHNSSSPLAVLLEAH